MDPVKYYRKYLEKNLKQGYSYKEIRKAFVSQGHDPDDLDDAYHDLCEDNNSIIQYKIIFLLILFSALLFYAMHISPSSNSISGYIVEGDCSSDNLSDFNDGWTCQGGLPPEPNETIVSIVSAGRYSLEGKFNKDVTSDVSNLDCKFERVNKAKMLRVEFDQNLTSDDVITIYISSNQYNIVDTYLAGTKITIYSFNTTKSCSNKYYMFNISLANLTSPTNVFDFYGELEEIKWDYIYVHQAQDNLGPLVTLRSPKNGYINYDGNVTLEYNVTDDNDIESCSLYLDGNLNQTDNNITKDIPQFFNLSYLDYGDYNWSVECTDEYFNTGKSETWNFSVDYVSIDIAKSYDHTTISSNDDVNATINLTITHSTSGVYYFNVIDELPFSFNNDATIYLNSFDVTNITTITNFTTDQTYLNFTINNVSQALGYYAVEGDVLRIEYSISSGTSNTTEIELTTNGSVLNIDNQPAYSNTLTYLYSTGAEITGQKDIISYVDNPQNFSVGIEFIAPQGPITNLALSDYLPSGAVMSNFTIYYYNSNLSMYVPLELNKDYIVYKSNGTLVDGNFVDVYYYNLSYNYTNWNGYLYDNDSIILDYQVSTIGGGEWVLPTSIAAFDPIYQKHIQTETSRAISIPLFDVNLNIINNFIQSGENIDAIISVLNVGGPKARVDVLATYSIKDLFGKLLMESSESFAVSDYKKKEMEFEVPTNIEAGNYIFEVLLTYAGREAMATEMFNIEQDNNNYVVAVIALAMISIGLILFMLRRR